MLDCHVCIYYVYNLVTSAMIVSEPFALCYKNFYARNLSSLNKTGIISPLKKRKYWCILILIKY